jgi:hypothetical protein
LNIAIISGWLFLPNYCGTRKLVYQTAVNLAARGHKVLLVMTEAGFDKDEQSTSHLHVDFQMVPLKKLIFNLYCILHIFLGKLCDSLWTPISNVIRSEILRVFWKRVLLEALESFVPNVIIAEDMYVAPVALFAARKMKVPCAYRIHHIYSTLYTGHPFERILRKWEQSVFQNADLLLALTPQDKRVIREIFGVESEVVGFGVDLPNYQEKEGEIQSQATKYVLYVSSYLGKESSWLKRAAVCFPDTDFVFVGRGSEANTKLPKNIRRCGIITDQKLASLYQHCRFVLIPFEWNPGQGVPIKLIEAFRCNRPILVNRNASWLLPNDSNGVYTFTTQRDFCEKIRTMLERQEITPRDSSIFNWESSSRKLEERLLECYLRKMH